MRRPSRSWSTSASACRSRQVSIVHGDTDKVQMGMGTYGSRSGAVGMSAIVKALDKVEAKAKKIAAHLIEADEGDIVIENGALKVAGTDKNVPWFQVALAAYTAHNLPAGMEPGLKETRLLRSVQLHLPGGLLHLRGRGRSGDRHDRDRPVRGGRRFRQHHQSDDRRGPGAWRHRARRRPGAARRRALRQPAASSSPRATWTTPCRAPTICRRSRCRPRTRHARAIRSASRAAARPARSARRRRSSTPSPMRSATTTSPCRRRRAGCGKRSCRPRQH